MIASNGISVVLGVLNEGENVRTLIAEFDHLLSDGKMPEIIELIFVDDGSRDATLSILEDERARKHEFEINVIRRTEKMGTLNAQVIGSRYAKGEFVLIMDSDLQHPVSAISEMVHLSKSGFDLIVASRYVKGGKNNWNPKRGVISRGAVAIAHSLLPRTRKVKDPISGFFLCRRRYVSDLKPFKDRYKLLLYILSSHNLRPIEIPITFCDRKYGESKVIDKKMDFVFKYFIEVITYMRESNSSRITNTKPRARILPKTFR